MWTVFMRQGMEIKKRDKAQINFIYIETSRDEACRIVYNQFGFTSGKPGGLCTFAVFTGYRDLGLASASERSGDSSSVATWLANPDVVVIERSNV